MSSEPEPGELFVVATPIGNLGDITLRAVEALRGASRVVAEDTRRTRGLLSHLGIAGKPLDRLDAHADAAGVARVVARVLEGERVALVTDAGTPVVSDPGTRLVEAAIVAGVRVTPIPGACAAVAAVSVSGLCAGGFRFVGFLPRGGPERRAALALVAATPEPVALYESPQRLAETLSDLARPMPSRAAMVARELTKVHEETVRGTLAELAALDRAWIGEITVVLGPAAETEPEGPSDQEVDLRIDAGLAEGRRAKDLAEELALETGRPRREVYSRIVERREQRLGDQPSRTLRDARAADILTVLRARGVAVPDPSCERILAEKDPARLERWLQEAATASSLGDVFDEANASLPTA